MRLRLIRWSLGATELIAGVELLVAFVLELVEFLLLLEKGQLVVLRLVDVAETFEDWLNKVCRDFVRKEALYLLVLRCLVFVRQCLFSL